MRYLALYRPGREDSPPNDARFGAVVKLIQDMAEAGVLIATDGCLPSSKGARVRIDGDKFTVKDGPFAEAKEVIGGFCMFRVNSKEEAIEWTKRFLRVMGEGESEIRQLHDVPAYPPEAEASLSTAHATV